MHRTRSIALFLLSVSLLSFAAEKPSIKLLPLSQQMAVRESWLPKRYEMLSQMMRARGIDMFIVVNEEFHPDPLTEYIAPPRPYVGNRDFFIFINTPTEQKRIAVVRYPEENLRRFFELSDEAKPADKALAEVYAQYQPKKIALIYGGNRGVTRSLTHDSYEFLAKTFGPDATSHFVPAADLVEEYLDTRLPEEMSPYMDAVRLTEELARRALSNEVITPGKTTVGDVRRWLYDQLWAHSVTTWFQPDMRVQRKEADAKKSHGFLAVADEATVIQRGDLIHLDFGITYMGLNTDWQKMAYVLNKGEKDAPIGLQHALKNTNTLQDALMQTYSRPGKPAGEVYSSTMEAMKSAGIEAMIYSHPLGNQGHALGAGIDFRASQRKDSDAKVLRKGSYIAIELNTATPVPEWNNQKVYMMEEDPAWLSDTGWKFFVPRQEKLYLIR